MMPLTRAPMKRRAKKLLDEALNGREKAALRLVAHLKAQFGWAVLVYTRGDADSTLSDDQLRLSDAEWQQCHTNLGWQHMLDRNSRITPVGLTFAVDEAIAHRSIEPRTAHEKIRRMQARVREQKRQRRAYRPSGRELSR